ncbi:hypothetical protein ACFCV3_20660 [Kribbella sp. NPDC056345]|uniref:hypothetical protein n=1 Tax=Kribbella sp. NPDC056345 TaxID=3345789 RepID=UPI0035E25812
MSRRRVIVLLAVAVAILVAILVLTWWNPFNLRYREFLVAASTGLAAVSAAALAVLVWRRRAVLIAAVVLGSVVVVLAGGMAWLAAELAPGPVRDRAASPDGRYELVRVWGVGGPEVRLRRDRGLLSQETVVWRDAGGRPNGLDSGTAIPEFRFVDARSIELTTYDGCSRQSAFDTTTLVLSEHARAFPTTC